MSTIIVPAILVAVIAVFIMLFVANERKKNRSRTNELLISFSQAAIKHNLFISKQEIVNERIIGLDGVNRKLLFVYNTKDKTYDDMLLDLDMVMQCSVESISSVSEPKKFNKSRLDHVLEKIVLRFQFYAGNMTYEIPFYTYNDSVYRVAELQQKAKEWESTIKPLLHQAVMRKRQTK